MIEELTQKRDQWKHQYEVVAFQNKYHRQALNEQNNFVQQLQQTHAHDTMKTWEEANQLKQENEVLQLKLQEAKVDVTRLAKNYDSLLNASLLVTKELED